MPSDAALPAGTTPASSGRPLAHSAGLAGVATLTSRILGLARDQVLAAFFGAGNEMDAFIVAFRVPNLLRDLFAEGAMSAAFVPTFARSLSQGGRPAAWRLGNHVLNAVLIVTGILVVAGVLFAHPLVAFYASDFATVPGKLDLTVTLTRVLLPFLTLVSLAAVLMGMLNALHHYFVPALAPAMFNVATIVGAFVLVPLMPVIGLPRIAAIAIAALAGGLAQVAIQIPPLMREGFRYRPVLAMRDPNVRRVLALMGPGTLGLAATQVNLFVNTLLATSQGTGAVSWLTYAFRLMYLPIGLFGVSIATAVLPAAAHHAAADDVKAIRATVARGLSLMFVMNVPATIGLIVLATPIIRLLFERGHFLPSDTAATADALQLYSVGLVGYASARIVSPVFYALGRSRVPVVASIVSIAVNIAASVTLVRLLGFRGLALGTSLAAIANAVLLLWLLREAIDGLHARELAATLVKISVASIAMAVVAHEAILWLPAMVSGTGTTAQAVRLLVAIGSALAALVAAAKLLGVREFDELLGMVRPAVQKLLVR